MKTSLNRAKMLLVGDSLKRLEKTVHIFQEAGFELLFASDCREGFRLTRCAHPDIVLCEIEFPEISGLDLCRMIRADKELSATPFVFVSEIYEDSKSVINALCAGADDCLSRFFNSQYFLAKILWLIEQKHSEMLVKEYFQILRSRQLQIMGIIKQTSELIENLNYQNKVKNFDEAQTEEFEKFMSQRIDLGFSMINSLAHLLDEQVRALDILEGSVHKESILSPEASNGTREFSYYEISM